MKLISIINNLYKKFQIYGPRLFIYFAISEIWQKIIMQLIRGSFSQQGEDLIIDKLLNYKTEGFYVDVGANDPDRFSNTKRFYNRGWRGINIEPNNSNYKKFLVARKDDINMNIGIGERNGKLKFYKFFPDAISTFSKEQAEGSMKEGYVLEQTINLIVKPLRKILVDYCKNITIDFLSIDTEGLDYQVLKSNDWKKFKPKVVCVERLKNEQKKVNLFLKKFGYEIVNNTNCNSIYIYRS